MVIGHSFLAIHSNWNTVGKVAKVDIYDPPLFTTQLTYCNTSPRDILSEDLVWLSSSICHWHEQNEHFFPPWKNLPKTRFNASRAVFWSLTCYKELKRIIKPFTVRTLRGLPIQMQNISLRSLGMCRKQNFEGFKSNTAVLTLTFRFLSSPLFSLFLPHFFFLLLGI